MARVWLSFITKRLYWIQAGGTKGGIGSKRERNDGSKDHRDKRGLYPRYGCYIAGERDDCKPIDRPADRQADYQADRTADRGQGERLDKKLNQDLRASRTDRLADADLARSLGDRNQHNIHDTDARN